MVTIVAGMLVGMRPREAAEFSFLLALPTLEMFPPSLDTPPLLNRLTGPFNLSQTPALSLPVPVAGNLPTSLQLVGPWDREDLLCATGGRVESALGRM